jgi:Fe2+ or Zn2+ uptake regulation protein
MIAKKKTPESEISDTRLAEHIRNAGLRPTRARIAILKSYSPGINHQSCEQIVKKLISSSTHGQATVYQNVKILAEYGLLKAFKGPHGMLFHNAMGEHHHHLVCKKCGTIADVLVEGHCENLSPYAKDPGQPIDSWQIDNRSVEFFGVCPECSRS